MVLSVPFHRQEKPYTCGPACLRMLFSFYEMHVTEQDIARLAGTNERTGTADKVMARVAREQGFSCRLQTNAHWEDVLLHLQQGNPVLIKYIEPSQQDRHFALIIGCKDRQIFLHDPWNGEEFCLPLDQFKARWLGGSGSLHHGWMMVLKPKVNRRVRRDFLSAVLTAS